jgi:CheY-like chemotaxis protein
MVGEVHVGRILLAEDNPGDVRLTKEMFENAGFSGTFVVVTDGEEALEFLRQRGEYADAARPDLVLLDWHFPKKSGSEVLAELRADDELADLPVIVLTGTKPGLRKLRSGPARADAYVLKPIEPEECRRLVEEFCQ